MRAMAKPAPRFADRTFDARPDRLDIRDLPYRPPLRSLPPRFPADAELATTLPSYVREGLILDQGTEGACTGFGLACVVNYLYWVRAREAPPGAEFERVSPRMLYELARRYDEWRGEDYEGSSCRGALKGWHKHGVCAERLWPYPFDDKGDPVFVRPFEGWDRDGARRPLGVYYRVARNSVVDLQAAIADIGAVYASAGVHDGWDALQRSEPAAAPSEHAALPIIEPPKDRERGGHAFALVGYNEHGFVVQNSWGPTWGAGGFGILPYDDWVENATDAWACALGVPVHISDASHAMRPVVASRWRVGRHRSLVSLERGARNPANPPDDPWPIDRSFECERYHPWSTHDAYASTLVCGNDGRLVVADFTRDPADAHAYARDIAVVAPLHQIGKSSAATLKLAIYAHGGLNNEEESIRRIRVLAPYFAANGIYPLFLTWKTGVGDTLANLVQDWAGEVIGTDAREAAGWLEALGEAKDRAVEALAHVLGRGLWTEMRENAEQAKLPAHCLDALSKALVELTAAAAQERRRVELHLVGHSAGAILLGHLLDRVASLGGAAPRFRSCTLFAPACSMAFAARYYLPAASAGLIDLKRVWIHVLSHENEKRDGLPAPSVPAYGKSLLYLVSRALDDRRKMPLLGLARALDPAYADDAGQWAEEELQWIHAWHARWKPGSGSSRRVTVIERPDVRSTRVGGQTQATHGSFDNNLEVMTETLRRIAGKALIAPLEWLDY